MRPFQLVVFALRIQAYCVKLHLKLLCRQADHFISKKSISNCFVKRLDFLSFSVWLPKLALVLVVRATTSSLLWIQSKP